MQCERDFCGIERAGFAKCFLGHSLYPELVQKMVYEHLQWLKYNLNRRGKIPQLPQLK